MDGEFARRCCAGRRNADDCASRSAPPMSPPCSWSATPTPPSTSSAHSTRSTANPIGSATASGMRSSSRTSSCLRRSFPEGPAPIGQIRPSFRGPSVTPSASFLATTRMAINAGRTQGMQVGNGADMVLRHLAEAEGKIVEGLETLQLQLDMFNKMPATPAAAPAHARARGALGPDNQMEACRRRWARCNRHGSAATRASSCACSTSSTSRSRHLPDDVHRAE